MSIATNSGTRSLEMRILSTNGRVFLHQLGTTLAAAYGGLSNPRCRQSIAALAANIDGELREKIRPPTGDSGVCVVRGLHIDEQAVGRTAPIWAAVDGAASLPLDLQMLLLASMIGEPFGWQGQQEGRLVNNVMPAKGYETVQTGASSEILLSPHTEDAFHPHRSHVFLLACVRNFEGVATTISSIRDTELSDSDIEILSRPTIPILPDLTYGDLEKWGDPVPIPTLWERSDGLCMRYDPDYTPWAEADPDYRAAYERLGRELERVSRRLVLEPGDVAIVDNDMVVHGRVPFTARFDGTDRWLKRVNISMPDRPRPVAELTENGYDQQVDYLSLELK
ncbi:TauD/TfdA family dioxygenase [Nocardia fluminea]|uniref:TfdA family taurine catabolism dioxygenase TauD n=1 Tax=Nocardia fluminea TaxID=134984 RepID=A0A2N3WVX0_9NOCA|nr:TauD/TfdA family dioxygenase [Nocardia fluminea]PKV98029.1 TfdA family taurine catabolism dioxygenase TauD [Nocardia fluminea]